MPLRQYYEVDSILSTEPWAERVQDGTYTRERLGSGE